MSTNKGYPRAGFKGNAGLFVAVNYIPITADKEGYIGLESGIVVTYIWGLPFWATQQYFYNGKISKKCIKNTNKK